MFFYCTYPHILPLVSRRPPNFMRPPTTGSLVVRAPRTFSFVLRVRRVVLQRTGSHRPLGWGLNRVAEGKKASPFLAARASPSSMLGCVAIRYPSYISRVLLACAQDQRPHPTGGLSSRVWRRVERDVIMSSKAVAAWCQARSPPTRLQGRFAHGGCW
jgi:hypothetical protein